MGGWRTLLLGSLLVTAHAAETAGQPAGATPWLHYQVCASSNLSQPDRSLFDGMAADMAEVVRQRGGRVAGASADRACVTPQELTTSIGQSAAARQTSVILDGPAFRSLSRGAADMLAKSGLRPVNPRLFTRPLYIFESADPAMKGTKAPNVGVLLDREVSASAIMTAVAQATGMVDRLTGKPSVEIVAFNTASELARCLERGSTATTHSRCPGNFSWAAFVEQDASMTLSSFRAAYQQAAGKPPVPLGLERLRPGLHGDNPDQLVLIAADTDFPQLGEQRADSGRPLAAIPRADGPALEDRLQQETRREQGWGGSLWALVGVARLNASEELLRYPFPVVLGTPGFPDASVRSVIADSYLRALGAWQVSPCSASAERLYRAYLLNAHLENPADRPTRLGLGSALSVARGSAGGLDDVLQTLQLSAKVSEWREALATPASNATCVAASARERYPEQRLFFANPNLISQYRAMEHLRKAASQTGNDRRDSLASAGACLKEALDRVAGPSCHAAERSTYSFYYNPYFYFAVQQASGGRDAK